jgi:signal transduction protein with GAF and PtsI domain
MGEHGWKVVGEGTPTWSEGKVEGVIADVRTSQDVLDLLDADMSEVIVLMHTAGATMLAPVFSELTGVVCTTGNVGSHVAILSREYAVPSLVGTALTDPDLHGRRVRLSPNGEISVIEERG